MLQPSPSNSCRSLSFRKMSKYRNEDGKIFTYPPPNYSVWKFIDNKIASVHQRGEYDNSLLSWMKVCSDIIQSAIDVDSPPTLPSPTRTSPSKSRVSTQKIWRVVTPTAISPTRPARKRPSPEQVALNEKDETIQLKQAELESALERIRELMGMHESDQDMISTLKHKLLQEEKFKEKLEGKMKHLQQQKAIIPYYNLAPGGLLSEFVQDFTYFSDFETNDAFLDMLNYADHSEESRKLGGLCEHLVRYSKVPMEKRKLHKTTC